jgi:hypothetical protein
MFSAKSRFKVRSACHYLRPFVWLAAVCCSAAWKRPFPCSKRTGISPLILPLPHISETTSCLLLQISIARLDASEQTVQLDAASVLSERSRKGS